MVEPLYTYSNVQSPVIIAQWSFDSQKSCCTDVLPDGCRDIIVEENVGHAPKLFISTLSHSVYTVLTSAGTRFRGFRLRPGIQIRETELHTWLQGRNPAELFDQQLLSEFCFQKDNLSTALDCLASEKRSVTCVAKELGVSLRTLERLVKSGTGQTPNYWFSLARIRKTARSIYQAESLSSAAQQAGFTDQSHMNREIKKWFQKTPAQLSKDHYVHSILLEAGYG